jgi:DNA primase large subunit
MQLDFRDLAHYPFLDQTKQAFAIPDLTAFLKTEEGKHIVAMGADKISRAFKWMSPDERELTPREQVLVFVAARVIASASKSPRMMDTLAEYDTKMVMDNLGYDRPEMVDFISDTVSVRTGIREMPHKQYIALAAGLQKEQYRLVNRTVLAGMVAVTDDDAWTLRRQAIRNLFRKRLPLSVPSELVDLLQPQITTLMQVDRSKSVTLMGEIAEECYPPCIRLIITDMTNGVNKGQAARFMIVAFCREIGMTMQQIIELFQRQPDFDLSKSQYQMQHITDHAYKCPACATCRTNNLCAAGADKLCAKVKHPLNYYIAKKRKRKGTTPHDTDTKDTDRPV